MKVALEGPTMTRKTTNANARMKTVLTERHVKNLNRWWTCADAGAPITFDCQASDRSAWSKSPSYKAIARLRMRVRVRGVFVSFRVAMLHGGSIQDVEAKCQQAIQEAEAFVAECNRLRLPCPAKEA
jgi:hypothetical protein